MNITEAYFYEDEAKTLDFASIGRNVKIKKNVGIVGTENITIGDNVRNDDFTMIMASGEPCRTTGALDRVWLNCDRKTGDVRRNGSFQGKKLRPVSCMAAYYRINPR